MRRAAVGLLLVAAVALVVFLWRSTQPERAARQEAGAEDGRTQRAADAGGGPGAANTAPGAAAGEGAETGGPRTPSGPPVDGRLVYEDGSPAAGVWLHRAIAVPFRTRIYRAGDFPEKTVWLVLADAAAQTAEDGAFSYPGVPAPDAARAVLYTEPFEPAFVLAEDAPGGFGVVAARRRVKVTGALRDDEDRPLSNYWIGAQLGWPEDWTTRKTQEKDSFVNRIGDLGLDPEHRVETVTDGEGRFELVVAAGRNTFFFGDWGGAGKTQVDVPAAPRHDVGVLRVPGPPPAAAEERSLSGVVLDCAGRPNFGIEVRVWDGNTGPHSHEAATDEAGRWHVDGLRSGEAIVWAVSAWRPHAVLPEQCSGKVALPSAPLTLRAPSGGEYRWMTGPNGFWLLEREGVLLWADRLDGEPVGVPPGLWRVAGLADHLDGAAVEATFAVREGGEGRLPVPR